jgi:hypothetical protein
MPDYREKMSFHGLRSGIRWRGTRLARRHPNGESEGMVRTYLRRDMAGIPKISGPQERERVAVEHPGRMSSLQGSTVPSGEPGSQGQE